MKKILVTIVLAISLAGSFLIAQGSESLTQGQTQSISALNNAPGSMFVQHRRWRRWRRWRRHERRELRRERRHERRERRRQRRHNM
jgi:hypothetical protein